MTKEHIQQAITAYLAENPLVGSSSYVGDIFGQNGDSTGQMTIRFNGPGRLGYIPYIKDPKISYFSSETKEGVNASEQLLEILEMSGEKFYGNATISGGTHVSGVRRTKAYNGSSDINGGERVDFRLRDGPNISSSSKGNNMRKVQYVYYYPNGADTNLVQIAALLEGGQKRLAPDVADIDGKNVVSIKYDFILPGHFTLENAFVELEKIFPGSEIVLDILDYSKKNTYNVPISKRNVKAIMESGVDPADINSMYFSLGSREGDFKVALNEIENDGNPKGYNLAISAFNGVKPHLLNMFSKSYGWKDQNGSVLHIGSIMQQLYEIEKSRKN